MWRAPYPKPAGSLEINERVRRSRKVRRDNPGIR